MFFFLFKYFIANFVCKLQVRMATGGTKFCVKVGPNLINNYKNLSSKQICKKLNYILKNVQHDEGVFGLLPHRIFVTM